MRTAADVPAAGFSPAAPSLESLATLAAPHDQGALRERLDVTATSLRARFRASIAAADTATLARVPAGGGWSALQVLEHLVVAHDDYARVVTPIVAQPFAVTSKRIASATLPTLQWKPSFLGRILAKSLVSPRALPAPKSWRVAALTPRADVADAFDHRMADLQLWMERSHQRDWRHTRTHSPISPLLRLNLGDVFVLLTVHAARHLGQLERATRQGEG